MLSNKTGTLPETSIIWGSAELGTKELQLTNGIVDLYSVQFGPQYTQPCESDSEVSSTTLRGQRNFYYFAQSTKQSGRGEDEGRRELSIHDAFKGNWAKYGFLTLDGTARQLSTPKHKSHLADIIPSNTNYREVLNNLLLHKYAHMAILSGGATGSRRMGQSSSTHIWMCNFDTMSRPRHFDYRFPFGRFRHSCNVDWQSVP